MKFTHHCKSQKNHTRDFLFCSTYDLDVQGYEVIGLRDYRVIVWWDYGVNALHVVRLIWFWGYRYIEFSDFSKCFLRLGRNPDDLESNGLRFGFSGKKYMGIS